MKRLLAYKQYFVNYLGNIANLQGNRNWNMV